MQIVVMFDFQSCICGSSNKIGVYVFFQHCEFFFVTYVRAEVVVRDAVSSL